MARSYSGRLPLDGLLRSHRHRSGAGHPLEGEPEALPVVEAEVVAIVVIPVQREP